MIVEQKSQLMTEIFSQKTPREEWKTVKLGDICTINSGKGIKKSEYLEDGTYPIIGANGEIGRCNQSNNNHPVLTTGRVGTIGTIQKVKDAWITDNTLIVDNIDNSVDYNFLYYTMCTIDFGKITTGNAQPLVTAGRLKDVEIAIPPLVEQRKIAKILSEYDELIQTKRTGLANIEKSKAQLMNSIFTERESLEWQTYKLEDICNIYDRLRKPISSKDRISGEYPYYGANGVQDYVEGYIFDGNYILVGEDGSVITENGNPVVNLASGKFWANNHVHVIDNKKDKVDLMFLYFVVQNADIKTLVHGNIPKLNQADFRSIKITLPPLSEQKRIAKLLSEYDELIKTNDSESETLIKSKNQLMNSIFVERESLAWTTVKLGDIFINVNDKGYANLDILTIYQGKGTTLREESGRKLQYDREDLGKYKRVLKGDFIAHLRSHEGGLEIANSDGLVSPAYTIIRLNNKMDNCYFKHLFRTPDFIYDLQSIATGIRQGKNIKWTSLKELEIQVPSLSEQQRISQTLTDYDELTYTLDKQIEVLKNTKAQLMNSVFA